MAEATITLQNAPHWLNHSYVNIKEDLLAEDSEWISNQATRVVNAGTSFARIEQSLGSANLLLIKRMVVSGVVAVKRSGDRIKTVNLPQDANKLMSQDAEYIATQIGKLNEPMTEEQQQDFLPDANAPSEANVQTASDLPMSTSDANSTQS